MLFRSQKFVFFARSRFFFYFLSKIFTSVRYLRMFVSNFFQIYRSIFIFVKFRKAYRMRMHPGVKVDFGYITLHFSLRNPWTKVFPWQRIAMLADAATFTFLEDAPVARWLRVAVATSPSRVRLPRERISWRPHLAMPLSMRSCHSVSNLKTHGCGL